MQIATTGARLLLGVIFGAAGISGFLIINNPPPAPPGLATAFQNVFFASHWVLFVDAIECVAGVLLVANVYVPLALLALAGVIYNMFVFHLMMMPIGLPAPIIATALWILTATPYRAVLEPLLKPKLHAP
jgi:hypothetical protein